MAREYISNGLVLVAGHLNTSYSIKVTPDDVAEVLRAGTLDLDSISESKASLLHCLFTEHTPVLIMKCIEESGASIESAQALYQEIVKNYYRVPEWEQVAAIEKFKKRVLETYPDAQFGEIRRGDGDALELDVVIDHPGIVGAEPVQAAANDVFVADGVYIVPRMLLGGSEQGKRPLERLRGSVKSFHRPLDPADD